MDETAARAALVRHWAYEGKDYDISHEIYHDDAVLEFPQSGERFLGRATFLEWRKQYPATLEFRIRRITGNGDLWVTENLIAYDGAPPMFSVNVLTFRGDRIAHEAIYIMEGFPAADWRRPWSTPLTRSHRWRPPTFATASRTGSDGAEPRSRRPPPRDQRPSTYWSGVTLTSGSLTPVAWFGQ